MANKRKASAASGDAGGEVIDSFSMSIAASYFKNFVRIPTAFYSAHTEALSDVEFFVDGTHVSTGHVTALASGGAQTTGWRPVWQACGLEPDDVAKFELLEGSPAVLRVSKMPAGTVPTITPGKRKPRAEAGPLAPKSRSTEYHSADDGSDSGSNSASDAAMSDTSSGASDGDEEPSFMPSDDSDDEEPPPPSREPSPGPVEVKEGTAVLLGPPGLQFGAVTALLIPPEGDEASIMVQAAGTDGAGPLEMPLEEAKERAEAARPGGLQGAVILKFFVAEDDSEEEKEEEASTSGASGGDEPKGQLFRGLVRYVPKKGWYHVSYEDGDSEDLEGYELLPLIERPPKGMRFYPPDWTGPEDPRGKGVPQTNGNVPAQKRRGRPPAKPRDKPPVKPQGQPSNGGDSGRKRRREVASVEEGDVEDAGPAVGAAQAKKRRQTRGKAENGGVAPAAMEVEVEDAIPGPSDRAVPAVQEKKATPAAKKPNSGAKKSGSGRKAPRGAAADKPEDPAIWTPCGAGHARGVQAYDRSSHSFKDIGRWISVGKHTTLPGRFGVDFRHLDLDAPVARADNDGAGVPGWIGVRGEHPKGTPATVAPTGPFRIVFYDTSCARQTRMLYPTFETAEEAARAYDRVALAYYGGATTDTNFPVDEATRAAAAAETKAGAKSLLIAAVQVLNLEQELPDEAVNPDVPQEDWTAWETALMDGFVYQRREASIENAAEVGGRLAWMLEQLVPEAFLPDWRSPEALAGFIKRCRTCKEVGSQVVGKREAATTAASLAALAHCARNLVVSTKALDVLGGGGTREEALAAGDEHAKEIAEAALYNNKKRGMDDEAPLAARRRTRAPRSAAAGAATATGDPEFPRPVQPAYAFKEPLPPGLRVAVIGGGVAGLKAAADLQRAGAEVTVLEARHRLGGRIHSATLTAPDGTATATVDLGAAFIEGTARGAHMNPLVPLMKDLLKLKTVERFSEGPEAATVYRSDGTAVGILEQLLGEERYTEHMVELMEHGDDLEYAQKAAAAAGGEIPDESVGAASTALLAAANPPLEDFEREIVNRYISDMYCAPLDTISLPGSIKFGYDGPHEAVVGGFGQLTAAIAAGKDHKAPEEKHGGSDGKHALKNVRLGRVVREVALGADGHGVRITAAVVPPENSAAGPQTQEIVPEDVIEVVETDAVVITLPLGVLKAGAVAFTPPLPSHKTAALSGLDVAPATRVAMLFPDSWWRTHTLSQFLRPLTGDYTFVNGDAFGAPNTLVAWVRPEAVERVEGLSGAQVVEDVLRVLRGMFPAANVPQPVDSAIARWGSDPCAHGAFMCVPVGGSKVALDALAVPVSGDAEADDAAAAEVAAGALVSKVSLRPQTRVFFAGDATNRKDPNSVQGAMETGRREARRVVEWWRQHAEAIKAEGPLAAAADEKEVMEVDAAAKNGAEEGEKEAMVVADC